MKIFSDKDDAPLTGTRPAATLGMFDGVHLGHRRLIARLAAGAREMGVPSLALTFAMHPRLTLGRSAPPGITDLDTRLRLLAEAGLDAAWVLTFTPEMAMLSGRAFAEEYFLRRLEARAVILGESARFGRERDGDAGSLAEWGAGWGMRVEKVPTLVVDGATVSSTAIRLAIQAGDIDLAAKLLGRPVSVVGTVVHGQGRGRMLGFPTLNLDPHHELRPPPGIYATIASVAGRELPSVTNIGRPPTPREIEAGIGDLLVETHLLDFEGDLYGGRAEVFFHKKLRDGRHFSTPEELARQIADDAAMAADYFTKTDEERLRT